MKIELEEFDGGWHLVLDGVRVAQFKLFKHAARAAQRIILSDY